MRRELWIVAALLLLSGCDVPQDGGYGYDQPSYSPGGYFPGGYPQPGYMQPGYSGAYPGYSYNDGAPIIVDGGMTAPLVQFGGQWGYYDRDRHWHHAPDRVSRDLDAHRGNGAGQFHPNDIPRGAPIPQPGPGRFGGAGGPPAGLPPAGSPPAGLPPAGLPPAGFRPSAPPPAAVAPQAAFRPSAPPPAAAPPAAIPRSPAPVGVMPRTVPRQPPP